MSKKKILSQSPQHRIAFPISLCSHHLLKMQRRIIWDARNPIQISVCQRLRNPLHLLVQQQAGINLDKSGGELSKGRGHKTGINQTDGEHRHNEQSPKEKFDSHAETLVLALKATSKFWGFWSLLRSSIFGTSWIWNPGPSEKKKGFAFFLLPVDSRKAESSFLLRAVETSRQVALFFFERWKMLVDARERNRRSSSCVLLLTVSLFSKEKKLCRRVLE